MLHHYNYSASSLPHLLSYNQLEDQNSENEQTSTNSFCEQLSQHMIPMCKSSSSVVNNKSFTIAAILGLKNDNNHHGHQEVMVKGGNTPTDLSVVNLSVHQASTDRSLISNCGRLQLPVRHGSSDGMTEHYTVGHGCSATARSGVRGLKHLSSAVMSNKKNCKSKRVRTIFTPEQLERLEAEFERQQYMVGPERLYLAHTLQLTEAQVKVWFQNRRIKWRKHHLELTHQRLAVLKQQQLLLDESHPDNQDTNSSSTDT